jgi:hypothetical protein
VLIVIEGVQLPEVLDSVGVKAALAKFDFERLTEPFIVFGNQ